MKRQWDIEELIDTFTLLDEDLAFLANKVGVTRLGCALLLKCFQHEGQFPSARHEIPKDVVNYVANQLKVDATLFSQYDWDGRTIKLHRTQIRDLLKFREATVIDTEEMKTWLISEKLASDQNMEHLQALVTKRFREHKIEPPTSERIDRLLHSACAAYEQHFFDQVLQQLPLATRTKLDDLLARSDIDEDTERADEALTSPSPDARPNMIRWHDLKTSPGAIGLESVLYETDKLRVLSQLTFPSDLFQEVSPPVLALYRDRAATEPLPELRRHPDATRYTYLSAFCLQRKAEIIDSLIDLLLLVIRRIETNAEKKIGKQVIDEQRLRVDNKPRLLRQVAEVALAFPDKSIRAGIYPVMDEKKCQAILDEETKGTFQDRVYLKMRASYRDHYRRMMPGLLNMLQFRSSNNTHQPVVQAIDVLKRYLGTPGTYYPLEENVPLDGVVRPMWRDLVQEKDTQGEWRVNRVNYELCVLEAIRDTLRCRELWVVDANKYRNPDDDLPKDFDEKREQYYQDLGHPREAKVFVEQLQQQMIDALASFDQKLPKLSDKVRMTDKKGGWIHLTPLTPQAEPQNLGKLKAEIVTRWGMTSLLDILKEADLRIEFTKHLRSSATREVLDRETLQKRFLLCLYGMGTNTGLKRISMGDHGQSYDQLLTTRQRYFHADQLRAAIVDIANATFQVRQPHIWGEGTTTCASDSTQFGAWDHNIMTEWHLRYGGKGIMIYWHVEKHATCIYSQLKTCSSSEVAAMIKGVLRHTSSKPSIHILALACGGSLILS